MTSEVMGFLNMHDLETSSDYFKIKMSDNISQFGVDGELKCMAEDDLTDEGKYVITIAQEQLKKWLYLEPHKLRKFMLRNLAWSIKIDQIEQEKVIDNLFSQMKMENPNVTKALAQIYARISENSRDRSNTVTTMIEQIERWYDANKFQKKQDKWDLNSTRLEDIVENFKLILYDCAGERSPLWLITCNILIQLLKMTTNVALVNTLTTQVKNDMNIVKNISLKMMKSLPKAIKSKSTESDTSSAKSTDNISTDNIININLKTMSKDNRIKLDPEKWQQNFLELAKSLGFDDNSARNLSVLLREVYTNPLSYLGPPKNLTSDKTATSQPLVVSRESWKSRRIKSLENRVCKRCGQKGHKENNCINQIKCLKCGEAHPTNECKKPLNVIKSSDMDVDNKEPRPKSKKRGRK